MDKGSKNSFRRLQKLFMVSALLYFIAIFVMLGMTWTGLLREQEQQLAYKASMLASTTEGLFAQIESVLQMIGERVVREDMLLQQGRTRRFLDQAMETQTFLAGFGIATPDGQLVEVSGIPADRKLPNLMLQEASREGFMEALRTRGMTVGRSYWFPLLGQWIIPLRLVIRDDEGDPIIASLTGIHLEDPNLLWNRVPLEPGLSMYLLRNDGRLQIRRPYRFAGVGDPVFTQVVPSQVRAQIAHSAAGEGAVRVPGFGLCNASTMQRYGITAVSCMDRDTLVGKWLDRIQGPSLAFMVIFLLGAAFYRHTYKSERKHTRQLQDYNKRLVWLAHHDDLTGLPNRTLFRDRLEAAMARTRRHGNRLALLILDLDHFKLINDVHGHQAGDQLLDAVARRLRQLVREGDTVARFGGDEFLILLEDVGDIPDIVTVAEKLIAGFDDDFTVEGRVYRISLSIGIAVFPDDAMDPDELVKCADTALYEAKRLGRNRFCNYSEELNQKTLNFLSLESGLRIALANEQFSLHYQPQIDLRRMEVVGVEALLRWHSPEMGWVSPADFIPVAESIGLMPVIGHWVLEQACQDFTEMRGMPGMAHLRMSVNVSAQQLRLQGFFVELADLIRMANLPASAMEIEITESVLVEQRGHAPENIRQIHEMGFRLALDDFGTGYSSLSYLLRFPISTLKIDRSFVQSLPDDDNCAVVTRAVVGMARNIGLHIVAEGVENEAAAEFLREAGCYVVQGYFYGKPMPLGEMLDFLAAWQSNTSRVV